MILHKGDMKRDDHWIAERGPYLDIAIGSQEKFLTASKFSYGPLEYDMAYIK